jgi:hypothetical protein
MNWKGSGRKWLWPNLNYYSGMYMEGVRKTMKNLRQAGIWGGIGTKYVSIMKLECYILDRHG